MTDVRQTMTLSTLCDSLDRFISDNQHSREVELRWLSSWLAEPLRVARQVRSDNLDHEWRKKVTQFRLAEIDKLKTDRMRDIEELDREAKKLAHSTIEREP